MLIISYDISDNKLRTQFSKLLEKHGCRLQYSVFEINNSERVLRLIKLKIEHQFKKKFSGSDSIFIFTSENNNIIKYGNAIHRDKNLIIM